MVQIARHATMADWDFLTPGHYLILDRDGKYCPALQRVIDDVGVKRVPLPPRSPPPNAYAKCWVRSIKEEALAPMILFGEHALRYALAEFEAHYHHERPHQGKGNVVLMLVPEGGIQRAGPIWCHERLGRLLKYYDCEAA
jgi:putative transposase